MVIDSIQTMFLDNLDSAPGTVAQVRTSAQELIRLAKRRGFTLVLVGHVTKEGLIAGPRVLEHMVDTVLYFEGERSHQFRILRAVKNRFGPADEIGVFEMTDGGLVEVANPSALFLADRQGDVSGASVFAGMEGTRPLLVEIQSLIAPSALGTPRRAVVGWDGGRLAMLLAVLEARCGLAFPGADVYLNVAGGLRIQEPGAHGVGALLFVDMAHIAGLVAAGIHPSPFPHADLVTTTTHKTLRGPRGGLVFSRTNLPDSVDPADFPMVKSSLATRVDKTVFPGVQGGPLMHVIAAKAVALLLAAGEDFRQDQHRTVENAAILAALADRGARVVSGGTDNHLMLVDVTPLGVTGREAEHLLDEIGITVNKNAIPFDPLPPNTSSGIRIGTPATTTRGFGPDEMRTIARMITTAIEQRDSETARAALVGEVAAIVQRFPVPGLPDEVA